MSTVYINIGFPGSGKSTYSEKFAKENENVVIINRDAFRSMIKGGEYIFDFRYEPFIKNATNRAIEQALEYGLDIIVDETHIKAGRRIEIIKTVRDYEESYGLITDEYGRSKIIYHWFDETERCLENRMKEARGYDTSKWEMVINGMKKSFEPPTEDEGYNELVVINPFKGAKMNTSSQTLPDIPLSSRFGRTSKRRLMTCDPRLRVLFSYVANKFDCSIIQGRRDKATQDKYFAEGKSKLKWPNSKHNVLEPEMLSKAVDVAPYIDGKICWDSSQCYYFAGYVMRVADELGLNIRWGGSWDRDRDVTDETFKDLVHYELDE